ncbi:hypothetical protein HPP92_006152 [Vanilla planifolia]|uniref:MIP18 family-like domain-containing protein n=1 Tax=Vanilla planifolia TaxID=51239 RepID=A0A835VFE0_VANPL|nr:hypothetical protein HPP92_006152 [Vanilla planifolia]
MELLRPPVLFTFSPSKHLSLKGKSLLKKAPFVLSSAHCTFSQTRLWWPISRLFTYKATNLRAEAPIMSLEMAEKDVLTALSQIIDPDFGTDIVSCGFVKDLHIDDAFKEVSFRLELTTPRCPIKDMVNV